MRMTVPQNIADVLETLENAGHSAYLVGGCVRDAALGMTPHDYDITTDARPDEMTVIFDGWRVIETGLKHGTLTVLSDGEPVEVTTYRIDGEYTDNRHPASVTFTDRIEEDLSRRDFTVNAMAYSPTRGLCDPFGGINHLGERLISCVGKPAARFSEDGLRILRALRFASGLDFQIDSETSRAVHALSHLLDGISRERIYSELCRLICGEGAGRIFAGYGDVLSRCFGGMIPAELFTRAAVMISSMPDDSGARLVFLFHLWGGDVHTVCRHLKTSRREMLRIAALVRELSESVPTGKVEIKRLMGRLTHEDILHLTGIRRGMGEETDGFSEMYEKLYSENPCVRIADMNIDGADVARLTGAEGAEIGRILGKLLELVIRDECENTAEALADAAKKLKL